MTSSEPLVSAVTATYDRPELLREALSSVCAQTFRNIEIIVTDDSGSPGNIRVIAELDDDRIRHVVNSDRLDAPRNKLRALELATGEYVANLDDDDVWDPEFLATLVPILEADPSVSVAFADHAIIDAESRVDERRSVEVNERYRGELEPGLWRAPLRPALEGSIIPANVAALFRREVLELDDYPADREVVTDYWTTYLALRGGQSAYYVRESLAAYRSHEGSSTSEAGLHWYEMFVDTYRHVLADPRLSPAPRGVRLRLSDAYRRMALLTLAQGRRADAIKLAARACRARLTRGSLGALGAATFLPRRLIPS